MPKISILNTCFSKQELLNTTLPHLLAQEGIDFELLLGIGPGITTPADTRITTTPIDKWDLNKTYNTLLKQAKHDILLLLQCDIDLRKQDIIKNMLAKWEPNTIVTEQFYRVIDQEPYPRDGGLHIQCCIVSRQAMLDIGGWYEPYSHPDLHGYEDVDIMASLLERGMSLVHTQSEAYHLHHETNYFDNGVDDLNRRTANAAKLFRSRHKHTPRQLLAINKINKFKKALNGYIPPIIHK